MKIRWFAIVLVAIVLTRVATADELLGWDVSGVQNFGVNGFAPTTISSGIDPASVLGLTRGSSLTTGSSGIQGWGATGWKYGSQQSAGDNGSYFTFGFTVASGYSVSISGISESYRRSSKAPDTGELQYSLDGGSSFHPIADLAFTTSSSSGATLTPSLDQVTALQNLAAGTSVVFRQPNWYSTDTRDSSAAWYIYNLNDPGNDFSVFGTAVAGGALLVGDINQDKSVNDKDVTAILGALTNMAAYESTYHLSPTAAATVLDVNQDSQMNNSDLQWLLDYLKTGHGSLTAVPEPATFPLGLLGAFAIAVGGMNSACRKRR